MYFSYIILKRRINLVQLADIIINEMNITRNDTVMVHSSLNKLKLIDSQPEDLIYLMKMLVGTQGTLLMPILKENQVLLPAESFSAWGKLAKQISEDTLTSENASDKNDLIHKLSHLKAKIIGIGDPMTELSFLHTSTKTANAIMTFRKRGIPFFVVNAEKVQDKTLLLSGSGITT